MHNSDVNLENSRLAKPLRPGGHPGFGQGVSAAARENEPQGVEGMKIAQTAAQSIGMSTRSVYGPFTGPPKNALAVSLIFTKATEQTLIFTSVKYGALGTSFTDPIRTQRGSRFCNRRDRLILNLVQNSSHRLKINLQ